MHTDKQIGLDFSGLLHANMQGDKKIGIARQVSPHGTALDQCGVDAIAQFECNLQHHIFLFGAIGSNGAWIFTAVSGVDGHHDQSIGHGRGGHIPLRALDIAWSRCLGGGTG